MWEEDCIEIKTEEDYIQLVRVIKTEEEVSVLCCCGGVCVCVCVHVCCTLYLVTQLGSEQL